jgi:hypothetical protein
MTVYTAAAVPGLPSAERRGYVATSTAIYILLFMCPHTAICMLCICVRILLSSGGGGDTWQRVLLCTCVRILIYMCLQLDIYTP